MKSNIDRALTIASESPDAHLALGVFHYWGYRDYDPALRELDRTVELQPNNANAQALRAWIYRRRGEWKQSLVTAKRAAKLDPRDPSIRGNIGSTYVALRSWNDAEHELTRALAMDPRNALAARFLALTYIGSTGDIQRAREAFEGVEERIGGATSPGSISIIIGLRAYLDVFERHFANALKSLDVASSSTPEARLQQLEARVGIQLLAGQETVAKSECEQTRTLLETRLAKLPEDQRSLTALA